MQNKHLLFNGFTVLCSILLSNIIFIIRNTIYIGIKLLRKNLQQNTITYPVSFFLVCACLSFTVTLWCVLVGKGTPSGPFKWIKDFLLAWKTGKVTPPLPLVITLQPMLLLLRNRSPYVCIQFFLCQHREAKTFHCFCAISPCSHLVLENTLA